VFSTPKKKITSKAQESETGEENEIGENAFFSGMGQKRKFSLFPSHSRAHTFTLLKRHFMKKMGDGNWETSETSNFFSN
jgi:hypothetical protein